MQAFCVFCTKVALKRKMDVFLPDFGEKSSLHLEISMIVLYLLKIAPFGHF